MIFKKILLKGWILFNCHVMIPSLCFTHNIWIGVYNRYRYNSKILKLIIRPVIQSIFKRCETVLLAVIKMVYAQSLEILQFVMEFYVGLIQARAEFGKVLK